MKGRNLQGIIDAVGNIVDYLFNNPPGPYRRALWAVSQYVGSEFTNWRDEQRAWREGVALSDQSHHMTEVVVRGPDAKRLLTYLGVNSPKGYEVGRARQFVACTPRGHLVGDAILYCREDGSYQLVGREPVLNWVQFHAETGGWAVAVERDELTPLNPSGRRRVYRYQLEGPQAPALLEKLHGKPVPELRFFRWEWLELAGYRVRVMRHGMVGYFGVELSGPYEEGPAVKEAILRAGEEFGLRQVGLAAYYTNALESGWLPLPVPGIYTGDDLRPYREWLPATSLEASTPLGGSFYSRNIEDYYMTPWDVGYGHIVKFDHEFVGRAALEEMARAPRRRKVTLVWRREDVVKVFDSLFQPWPRYKYIELPLSTYGWQYDEVRNERGEVIGVSTYCGYSTNEAAMLSLAVVDVAYAEPGTEVVVVWGEPGGGSRKPNVERHEQLLIRATVGPVPIAEPARQFQKAPLGGHKQ